ncbi:MAG: amidohydrolase [Candidatus Dactylopiibacterium carminicum]|uniref:Amidohydrolase n=1 Tax=Candidatus Dactylopiibacterium carminicum TaxID=857335 RepID=A0A272EY18_9RHOO|nr:M20 aminoacylase family protein [Candidatus Dactylopiibacterium carminicum]KAF7600496.1 amidohydrolase [Candidatus Dactylopiibacterium carminicum]PAS94936.1 MAG: amidohydrolase [Candidatus Dactylopiibacterium carminicum]PAS98071.1 MAG: amidohydrolase [Candidatus Dactylopiibacterium carminicum]PAT00500.1 MAG: amidohydrolase [Candidatus Dactylopiibacterium carminicum]
MPRTSLRPVVEIAAQADYLTALRRDIHAHPELAFEEKRTADLVASLLTGWGIPVHRGLGCTGVVGILQHGGSPRAVGLRADMDALPIAETNRFAHASLNPGRMHACGHDGHTTMLLGAAQYLAAHGGFDGTVYLIFQPAEEQGGGAREMMRAGLFAQFPMEAVFGLHNMPGIPTGTVALSPGPVLASNNEFRLTIHGKGGHAAMPHLAIDPIPVAAQIMQAFQTIISRNKPPLETAVISITMLHAGDVPNVIPDTCEMQGSVRAYAAGTLDLVERRMREIAEHTGAVFGARVDFEFRRNYPATINHARETAFAREVLRELLTPAQVIEQTPIMAAEDFSFMLEAVSGCYAFIGNGDGEHRLPGHGDGPCLVHNPSYDFNDAILPLGAGFLARLAQRWLARPAD